MPERREAGQDASEERHREAEPHHFPVCDELVGGRHVLRPGDSDDAYQDHAQRKTSCGTDEGYGSRFGEVAEREVSPPCTKCDADCRFTSPGD